MVLLDDSQDSNEDAGSEVEDDVDRGTKIQGGYEDPKTADY